MCCECARIASQQVATSSTVSSYCLESPLCKFCGTTSPTIYFRCHELEFECRSRCRYWTAKHPSWTLETLSTIRLNPSFSWWTPREPRYLSSISMTLIDLLGLMDMELWSGNYQRCVMRFDRAEPEMQSIKGIRTPIKRRRWVYYLPKRSSFWGGTVRLDPINRQEERKGIMFLCLLSS